MATRQILNELGVYGYDEVEDTFMTALVTGDPVLLLGKHGSAKTLLARQVAKALCLKYQEYDASKALFEDVIGFPNPKSLASGQISYVPTPISIWEKELVFIDEISRASPTMQNKWLEIVRSRQIMGLKVNSIKYVFSAMNPPGYLGSLPLDEALAGRFAIIINVPEVNRMETKDIGLIIKNRAADDAPGLGGTGEEHNLEHIASELENLIVDGRERTAKIEKEKGEYISAYVMQLLGVMKFSDKLLDGRRLGMIRRNIVAYLALKSAKNGGISDEQISNKYIFEILKSSLPYPALGEDVSATALENIHGMVVESICDKRASTNSRLKIFLAKDIPTMAKEYAKNFETISETDQYSVITHVEEVANPEGNDWSADFRPEGLFALAKISSKLQESTHKVKKDIVRKAMSAIHSLLMETKVKKQIVFRTLFGGRSKSAFAKLHKLDPSNLADCITILITSKHIDGYMRGDDQSTRKMVNQIISVRQKIVEQFNKNGKGRLA